MSAWGKAEAVAEERLCIDGELVGTDGGGTVENVNPATEAVLGVCADGSATDMDRATGAARKAFDTASWSTAGSPTCSTASSGSTTSAGRRTSASSRSGSSGARRPAWSDGDATGPTSPSAATGSGIGREMGQAGFEEYAEITSIAEGVR